MFSRAAYGTAGMLMASPHDAYGVRLPYDVRLSMGRARWESLPVRVAHVGAPERPVPHAAVEPDLLRHDRTRGPPDPPGLGRRYVAAGVVEVWAVDLDVIRDELRWGPDLDRERLRREIGAREQAHRVVVQVADDQVRPPRRRDRRVEAEARGVAPVVVGEVHVRRALDDVETGLRRGGEYRRWQLADAAADRGDVDRPPVLDPDRLAPDVAGARGDLAEEVREREAVSRGDVRMRGVVEEVVHRVRRHDDVRHALAR